MNPEHPTERERLLAAMAYGAAKGSITSSKLLSPAELSAAARDRTDLQGKVSGWCLCAQVPQGMWRLSVGARFAGVPNHLTVVEMGSGRRYLAVVLQLGKWQHRLCVPLVGKLTAEWLDTLVAGVPLQMSVTSPDSEHAFVVSTEVAPGAIAAFRDTDTSVPADWRGLIEEAMKFVAWNASVAEVDPVAQMPEPTQLSFSLLFPAEVEAEVERWSDAAAGRKVS